MSLGAQAILDVAMNHALTSGYFDRVNGHEPKNAPGNGLTAAVWIQSLRPVSSGSGLRATTGRLILNVRVYSNMLQEPQDAIDPGVAAAVDSLLAAYSGDFEFGGNVRNVDLLGSSGVPLSAEAGYQTIGSAMYRVMTITLPLIINDLWSQSP